MPRIDDFNKYGLLVGTAGCKATQSSTISARASTTRGAVRETLGQNTGAEGSPRRQPRMRDECIAPTPKLGEHHPSVHLNSHGEAIGATRERGSEKHPVNC